MTAPRDPQNTLGTDKKADVNSLLKKRIKDLTAAEIERMEVLLGTPDLPFPMWGTLKLEHEGKQQLGQALTVIAEDENPLSILSDRTFEEAWGIIARELPTPSMLPIFREMLDRMTPDSKNRQFFVMGDPGMGKSFMGGMISRVMSKDAPRVYDCGGKQMNSMLFEMVLDFGAGDGLAVQIEKRMMEGKLSQASVMVLRDLASVVNKKNDKFINELSDGVFEIDWNALSKGSEIGNEKMNAVLDSFNKIAVLEGLDKGGANMLGMNSQFGPMITDFIDGNFSTYDEYNKSKAGGDDQLQTVLQFINGEIDECTVENPLKGKDGVSGPTHFTFRREDVKAGWGILFTGNKSKDGATTRALNKSVYSRLGPRDLPEVSEADWAHRICQLMTGVPITTWYNVFKESADQNPESFADFLWHIRTSGLSKEQADAIPNTQKVWLQNWERVVSASEKLGKFFHGWRERLDEDMAMTMYDLDDEVDAEFGAEQALDFRRVIKVLQKASKTRAQLKPMSFKAKLPAKATLKKPPRRVKRAQESLETGYGSRLTEIIINDIFESSGAIGKPKLYASLMELAKDCALVEIDLQEGARSKTKTVEDELNISRFDSADIKVQAQIAQEVFCKMLRERFPEIQATDDEIVTVDRLAEIISDMRETADAAREDNLLHIPNQNIETLETEPFMAAKMQDFMSVVAIPEDEQPCFDDVLTTSEFLQAFVLPGVQDKNLNAIWDGNLGLRMKLDGYYEDVKKAEAEMADVKDKLKEAKADIKAKRQELKDLQEAGRDADAVKMEQDIATLDRDQKNFEERITALKADKSRKDEIIEDIKLKGVAALKDMEQDTSDPDLAAGDSALNVAENRSKTGLAFTTIACRIEDEDDNLPEDAPTEYAPVHVLRNAGADKTLIIADNMNATLRAAFNQAKVKVVDMNEEDAVNKINAAVSDVIRGLDSEETIKMLCGAFNFRNPKNEETAMAADLGTKMMGHRKIVQHPGDQRNQPIKFFYKPYAG